MSDFYLIAKVIAAGKEGFLKISSFSDFPDRFFNLEKVFIDFFGEKKIFFIDKISKEKEHFLFKFKNFGKEDDLSIFLNKEIFIDEENLIKLPDNYYFIHDLIGSRVLRNNAEFGIVKDMQILPANNVYIIEDKTGQEILIPAVSDYIESFDPEKKILILKPGGKIYEEDEN